MTPSFKSEGDSIFYVGADREGLGGSEYLNIIHNKTTGDSPALDLEFEARLQETLLASIQQGNVNAAHDISDGGLATTLAEMAIFSGMGADISTDALGDNLYEILYSEAQSGVVVTCAENTEEQLRTQFSDAGISCIKLGNVQGQKLKINDVVSLNIADLSQRYESVIPEAMKG